MIDSETRKLLEAHGLTAYGIERQSGHVTEQAIVALLTEVQEEAESRLDASYEAGYAKAQEDYLHELDAASAEPWRETPESDSANAPNDWTSQERG